MNERGPNASYPTPYSFHKGQLSHINQDSSKHINRGSNKQSSWGCRLSHGAHSLRTVQQEKRGTHLSLLSLLSVRTEGVWSVETRTECEGEGAKLKRGRSRGEILTVMRRLCTTLEFPVTPDTACVFVTKTIVG